MMKILPLMLFPILAFCGSIEYVPIIEIHPSQLRYSQDNVNEKQQWAMTKGYAKWDPATEKYKLSFAEGHSSLPETEALPVVRAPFGLALTDGHHEVLSSLALGADLIPVKIIADLSALSEEEFWNEMEKKGWAYPYAIGGNRVTPPIDFALLKNDPNRYFAAISARKFPKGIHSESFGAEYPLWIKVGKDIPFIEFMIADVLWKKGIIYDTTKWGRNPPDEFVEEARALLLETNIPGLHIVPVKQHYQEIDL